MAKEGFSPNQAEYYAPLSGYPPITTILGGSAEPADLQDYEVFNLNSDNYRAFLENTIPTTTEDLDMALTVLQLADPKFTLIPEDQRQQRQEISQQARREILDLAMQVHDAKATMPQGIDRTYQWLLLPGSDPATQEKNQKILKTIQSGTPEEKGQLFEERIRQAQGWLDRLQRPISDQELLGNLDSIRMSHNTMVDSQNILSLVNSGDIAISDEAKVMLQSMERNAPKMDRLQHRIHMMANPYYAYVDPDQMAKLNRIELVDLSALFEGNAPVLAGFMQTCETYISERGIAAWNTLMPKIQNTFDTTQETPHIHMVNPRGARVEYPFSMESNALATSDTGDSNILVTSASGAACYRIDENGNPVRTNLQQMGIDFLHASRDQIGTAASALDDANKGFFIGSRAYSRARGSVKSLFDNLKAMHEPPTPEEMARLKPILQNAVRNCEAYIATKDPHNFKNEREEFRYNAMQKALTCCKRSLGMHGLQEDAKNLNLDLEPYPNADLRAKVNQSYGIGYMESSGTGASKAVRTTIPKSDQGNIADELRDSTQRALEDILFKNKDEFHPEDAKNVLSNMILLQMVKNGRSLDENGNIKAGPIEVELAKNPHKVIDSLRNRQDFQNMAEDMTRERLESIIMKDGVKDMARHLEKKSLQPKRESVKEEPHPEKSIQLNISG